MSSEKLPKLISGKLSDFNAKFAKLREALNKLIRETCEKCPHPIEAILELPYQPDNSYDGGHSRPSWLICTDCGLTEEGWNCGHKILKHAEYKSSGRSGTISRDDWLIMKTLSIDNNGNEFM